MSVTTFNTGQYTASATAPVALIAANQSRTGLLIVNIGTVDVYLGQVGVTTATGHLLPGTKGSSVSIPTRDAVYAITGASTSLISYVESYI